MNNNMNSDVGAENRHFKWKLPGMVLIAGDGRNVGKTTFARQLIVSLSKNHEVLAIKTSPHFHSIDDGQEIIAQTSTYIVAEEKFRSEKDSSLLMQAGAMRSYFIMAKQEHLEEAFSTIVKELQGKIVIAESGGLNEFIQAGIFFFIKKQNEILCKKHYLAYNPIIVTNAEWSFDFKAEWVTYSKGVLSIKKI